MWTFNTVLLLSVAYATPASAAIRWEILRRQAPDHRTSNATVTPLAGDTTRSLPSTVPPVLSSSLSLPFITVEKTSVLNGSQTSSLLFIPTQGPKTTDVYIGQTMSTTDEPNLISRSLASISPHSKLTANMNIVSSEFSSTVSTDINTRSSLIKVVRPTPMMVPHKSPTANTTRTSGLLTTPWSQHSWSSSFSLSSTKQSATLGATLTSTSDVKTCTELEPDQTVIEYYIVHTTTTTLYGTFSHYTPLYPTIETPTYCEPTTLDASTLSNDQFRLSSSKAFDNQLMGLDGGDGGAAGGLGPSEARTTITFVTTDKNPAVVFATNEAPKYSESGKAASLTVVQHTRADLIEDEISDGKGGSGEIPKRTATTWKITARPGHVIINDKTISNLKAEQTTTVKLGQDAFTIFPTKVVGAGATIQKPRPVGTAISVVTPTTSVLGGLPVEVSGSVAVVGGTKIAIPPHGMTTMINHEKVSIDPSKIIAKGKTLTFHAIGGYETAVVVEGGEMVTAIGQSIYMFHSTTITYGPGIPERSEVVDNDTIKIGPSGIILHGTTIGGTEAKPTGTIFEIVGGATITELAPSFIIIDGTTFTAGPGNRRKTKVIGGETIKIGPRGAVIGSMTLSIPFGSSAVATITATAPRRTTLPTETESTGESVRNSSHGISGDGDDDEDEDSAGSLLEPSFAPGMTGLCILTGLLTWLWL
ncbi:hypothetical protein BGZ63DRAFT_441423 [Mariannaea sp. PMI_226]|nr:hypothetical protein BGZ63DRAFT_441423 [Mariannaea sp. PMI_226]